MYMYMYMYIRYIIFSILHISKACHKLSWHSMQGILRTAKNNIFRKFERMNDRNKSGYCKFLRIERKE